MGTIFNPDGLVHTDEGFWLEAGQSVMILPLQPDNSSWKMFKSALFDHRFIRNKSARNLCFILTNKWMHRSIYVQRGSLLSWLLGHPGIHHTMGYMTAYDLAHLKNRKNVLNEEDEDDDEDEDEVEGEEDDDDCHVVHPAPAQADPVSRPPLAPRMTVGSCQPAGNSRCCHHVDIIRP